ncbi:hypothetical protein EIP91_008289 [Steccherinum ochraceum]|uniref:Uncharacterized protein n=1 Tax=Steccherinum ochraceum TaxID=92696 RepID=A0A4R0RD55_9APHY|nr:hypothetical protein EIP91_008289 [Steccherinum ochraceum]
MAASSMASNSSLSQASRLRRTRGSGDVANTLFKPSAGSKVPPELIREIMILAVGDVTEDICDESTAIRSFTSRTDIIIQVIWTFLRVCSGWRSVLFGIGKLWTRIDLSRSAFAAYCLSQTTSQHPFVLCGCFTPEDFAQCAPRFQSKLRYLAIVRVSSCGAGITDVTNALQQHESAPLSGLNGLELVCTDDAPVTVTLRGTHFCKTTYIVLGNVLVDVQRGSWFNSLQILEVYCPFMDFPSLLKTLCVMPQSVSPCLQTLRIRRSGDAPLSEEEEDGKTAEAVRIFHGLVVAESSLDLLKVDNIELVDLPADVTWALYDLFSGSGCHKVSVRTRSLDDFMSVVVPDPEDHACNLFVDAFGEDSAEVGDLWLSHDLVQCCARKGHTFREIVYTLPSSSDEITEKLLQVVQQLDAGGADMTWFKRLYLSLRVFQPRTNDAANANDIRRGQFKEILGVLPSIRCFIFLHMGASQQAAESLAQALRDSKDWFSTMSFRFRTQGGEQMTIAELNAAESLMRATTREAGSEETTSVE